MIEEYARALAAHIDLVSVAYAITLAAYLVRDMLPLRALLALAALAMLAFGWQAEMVSMMVWNALFVVVNLVQLVLVIRERRPLEFDCPEARQAWETVFWSMSPREFLRLWHKGERLRLEEGSLLRQGQIPAHLVLLLGGELEVRRDGRHLTRIAPWQLVGEMSLITGEPASADVVVREPVELIQWRRRDLDRLSRRHPEMMRKLDGVIGQDLVRKLTAGTASPEEAAASSVVTG